MSNDTPGRRPQASDDDILAVFRTAADPVLTTSEVADQLPIGKRAVLDRLKSLADAGALQRKSVGPRGQVWWLATPVKNDDEEDPLLSAPTSSSGKTDISAHVDAYLVQAEEEQP